MGTLTLLNVPLQAIFRGDSEISITETPGGLKRVWNVGQHHHHGKDHHHHHARSFERGSLDVKTEHTGCIWRILATQQSLGAP